MSSLYVVQANPVAGKEREFEQWYDNQHLQDVIDLPGFVAARRYVRSATQREQRALEYHYQSLALYEFDGDPRPGLDALTTALANGMELSPALGDRIAVVYDQVSERR